MSKADVARVFLVGAGPGDPGLLTLRAVECLARADVVLYDRLTSPRVLEHAPAHAERICVTELAEHHPERCPHVHEKMIAAARQGKTVVRLKGGDPLIFGRGGEEAAALKDAAIPYEIVPGVTAAVAAAAYAGIPLTQRGVASAVAFVTGHEDPNKPGGDLDWCALARFPGTLVFYMPVSRLGQIVAALINRGLDSTTPAALVERASTGEQRTVVSPLHQLVETARDAKLSAPALLVIGPVVSLRADLAWFEQWPLFGKRVLVTRMRHQAGELARRLELLGAAPVILPVLELRDPTDWSNVDEALQNLDRYDWLVFTSANGVHALVTRLRLGHLKRDLRSLGNVKLAAIGPATAEALRGYQLEPDVVPGEYRSESLAAQLKPKVKGQRVLLARADRGRELLREELQSVAEVREIAVYTQTDVKPLDLAILDQLRAGTIDFVTLTSSNIARALLLGLDATGRAHIDSGRTRLATISPVTSATVRELGYPVAIEAKEYTTAGLIDAIISEITAG